MRLSSNGRFVVTAMIDVALRGKFGSVPLNDIASRQHISLPNLERWFSKFRLQGLATSVRGPGGRYSPGGRIKGMAVADILCAVKIRHRK